MKQSLTALFVRDLDKLKEEIESYTSEDKIWIIDKNIKNSAGNLALHLAGNLRHYIGALLGGSNFYRDREFEFNGKLSREELIEQIESAQREIDKALNELIPEQLEEDFPGEIPFDLKTGQFLLHLYGHLGYHLGQINYHRRLLDV